MAKLTIDDARQSLAAHVTEKGIQLYEKYGPQIGWKELLEILKDKVFVRYPCEIIFDAAPLHPGEFAAPIPKGDRPEDGFNIFVHPFFSLDPSRVPALVFYHLVVVNYGEFATADDAELFGAAALGILKDEYYAQLCALADEVSGDADAVG